MAFSAVSVPRVKSVPGTLLLIVAGIIVIGMHNSGYFSLASAIISTLWKAYNSQQIHTEQFQRQVKITATRLSTILGTKINILLPNKKSSASARHITHGMKASNALR